MTISRSFSLKGSLLPCEVRKSAFQVSVWLLNLCFRILSRSNSERFRGKVGVHYCSQTSMFIFVLEDQPRVLLPMVLPLLSLGAMLK